MDVLARVVLRRRHALLYLAACFVFGSLDHVVVAGANNTTTTPPHYQNQKLILARSPWPASYLNVEIARQFIESAFPHVELQVVDSGGTLDTVAYLLAHPNDPVVVFEIWPSAADIYLETIRLRSSVDFVAEAIGINHIEELGKLGVVGQTGWFVPGYVLDQHPEASSWEFYQKDEAANFFATEETAPKGRFLGGHPGWESLDPHIIRNLGLPFEIVYAVNQSDVIRETVMKKEPLLAYSWLPTAVAARYDLKKVQLPPVTEQCRLYLRRDTNFYDCDYAEDETLKFATTAVKETAPDVYPFLKAFTITNEDQMSLLPRIEFDGESMEEIAAEWIEMNRDKLESWLQGVPDVNQPASTAAGLLAAASFSIIWSLGLFVFVLLLR